MIQRIVATTIILAAGLLSGALTTGRASADFGLCNTDPIVTLSNGVTVTMAASIADNASDVKGVGYVLHAPAGTTVTNVQYADSVGAKEQLFFYADEARNTYDTTTAVATGTPGVAVTATTTLVGPSSQSGSTSGTSYQPLKVHISY